MKIVHLNSVRSFSRNILVRRNPFILPGVYRLPSTQARQPGPGNRNPGVEIECPDNGKLQCTINNTKELLLIHE